MTYVAIEKPTDQSALYMEYYGLDAAIGAVVGYAQQAWAEFKGQSPLQQIITVATVGGFVVGVVAFIYCIA
jgi:hypothetical protein